MTSAQARVLVTIIFHCFLEMALAASAAQPQGIPLPVRTKDGIEDFEANYKQTKGTRARLGRPNMARTEGWIAKVAGPKTNVF